MENIQNKSALIPSDEIRSEERLAEQKFEAFITCLLYTSLGSIFRKSAFLRFCVQVLQLGQWLI